MKAPKIPPLFQRFGALALLGVGLGVAVSAIALPLADAIAAREAGRQRLAHFEALLKAPNAAGPLYDPADLSDVHVDDAEAQIALQSLLDRLARTADVSVQSVRPQAAEYLGKIGRGVWVEMSFSCDLQALSDLMVGMNKEKPVLIIRRLDIERGDGARPDNFLRVQMEVGQAWRPVGAT